MNDDDIQFRHSTDTKVLGIGASPRKNGNTDLLLKHILEGARKEGAGTETVHLRDYLFQSCIGCERCRKDGICSGLKDGMQLLYPKIVASKGLVLVSPTHNYNITACMKAFIDRLYCFYIFTDERPRGWSSRLGNQDRKAGIAAVCEQVDKKDMGFTLEAMRLPIKALGYEVIDELPVLGLFDKGLVKHKEEILVRASGLGRNLAKSLLL